MDALINARGLVLVAAIVWDVHLVVIEVQRNIDKRCAVNKEMLRGLAIWQVLRSILLLSMILTDKIVFFINISC